MTFDSAALRFISLPFLRRVGLGLLRVVAPRPPMSPLQNPNQKKRWENVDPFLKNMKMKMSAAAKYV